MGRLNVLLPRLIRLRLLVLRLVLWLTMLRLVLLRLMMLLFAGIELLLFAGRERFAGHMRLIAIPIAITVVVAVIGRLIAARVARLLLEIGLRLAKLFLRRSDQTEVMFSVLIIIFGGNRISRTLRVAGKLEIFFSDVGRRSADFYILPVGFVNSRQRILVMATTLTVTTAHTLVVVLTVSHDLLSANPSICGAWIPPLRFTRLSVHQSVSSPTPFGHCRSWRAATDRTDCKPIKIDPLQIARPRRPYKLYESSAK
jgi:hypothetical protein